jgi:hypothetical protein
MSSIIDVLKEVVDDKYIHACNKSVITLSETGKDSTCGTITLQKTGRIKQVLVLDTDLEGDNIYPFLIEKEKSKYKKGPLKNLRKKVDYLMFCELEKEDGTLTTYIFPIELKSGNQDDWHRQAKAGYTFAQYLVGFVEVQQKVNFSLPKYGNQLEYRCVLFSSNTSQPRALRRKPKLKTTKATEYETHPIYQYQHSRRKCGERYFIEMFIN